MVSIRVDRDAAGEQSRLVLLILTTLTLRLMSRWREALEQALGGETDYESTVIVGAVLAINGEKLLRANLDLPLHSLKNPLPYELLTRCNVSSLAAATRLNRETVRRKIEQLVSRGVLTKENRSIHIDHGLLQLPIADETIEAHLRAFARAANQLERLNVVRAGSLS